MLWGPPKVTFLEPPPMVDGDLELVEPAPHWVESHWRSINHPMTQNLMPAYQEMGLAQLQAFVRQYPRGHQPNDPIRGMLPAYQFWMRIPNTYHPVLPIAGSIALRISHTHDVEMYLGHIGYHVYPAMQGHHYARRAARLLFPLARMHNFTSLWITTNPDNMASRKTCEALGGRLIEIVPVPEDHALYRQGDREKCRYLITL